MIDVYSVVSMLPIILLLMPNNRTDHQYIFIIAFSSEKEDEENFDLSLISSLESDVVPCLSHDLVPDYLITQLAKGLTAVNELDDDPPTASGLTKPDGRSTARGDKSSLSPQARQIIQHGGLQACLTTGLPSSCGKGRNDLRHAAPVTVRSRFIFPFMLTFLGTVFIPHH